MKLPILLTTLLSTAAIADPYNVIIQPSTYVNSQPAYVTQWNYIAPSTPTGSGLSVITDLGQGNYNVTASDGGLTTIRNNNGLTTITPADNRPMTLCTSTSCFQ